MKTKLITSIFLLTIFSCSEDDKVKEPISDFVFTSDNNFTLPTQITFTNKSSNAKEYTWDFGDGTANSNNINPTHEYTTPGVYNVTLISSNGDLFDQIIKEIEIFILPSAAFTFSSNNEFKAPSEITFTNTSLNGESYEWEFGDGQTSTLQNPIHSYTTEGTYSAKLKVFNSVGQSEKTETITILNPLSVEQIQLEKLSKTWNIVSAALDGTDHTSDFADFQITFSGTYNSSQPEGPYSFSVAGSRPTPSPWPAAGDWSFGPNVNSQIIRSIDEAGMLYTFNGDNTQLTLQFLCNSCDFTGSRVKSIDGPWTFVLN